VSTVSPIPLSPSLLAASVRPARLVLRGLRFAATFGGWVALGAVTGIAFAIAVPKFFGGESLTVMSGSMEPAIHTGDVVLTERIAPLDVKVGDVVTFRSPDRVNRLLTHRVREITVKGDRVHFVTKGDAVNGLEQWNVPIDAGLARPRFRLWKLGYPLFWLNLPYGRLLLYVLPVLLISGYLLLSIWRPALATQPNQASPPSNHLGPRAAVETAPPVAETVARSTGATQELVQASGPLFILSALVLAVFTVRRIARATRMEVR
jgi:signal peptidase